MWQFPPLHTHKHIHCFGNICPKRGLRQTLDCLLSCVLFFSFPHGQPEYERRQSFFYFPFLSVWGISLLVHTLGRVCYTFSPSYPTLLRLLWDLGVWMWEIRAEFLILRIVDIWGWIFLSCGAGLCIAASLASTHQIRRTKPFPPSCKN